VEFQKPAGPVKSPKRFLIFYLSIGSGHLSAANAIKKAIREYGSEYRVFCEDLFTPAIRDSMLPEFLSLSSTLFFPGVYDTAWQSGSMMPGYELLQVMPVLRNRVMEILLHRNPDMVICTHSLPCSIMASLQSDHPDLPPVAAVATDFMVHPYWPIKKVKGFVVACDEARERLIERGGSGDRIRVLGIPIDPAAENLSIRERSDDIKRDTRFSINVLILAGGKRLAPYVATWPKTKNLMDMAMQLPAGRVHWNVVCGIPSAFSRLLTEFMKGREDVTLYEYVTDFMELLSRQDFVITKPGGLILAEAMALGIPAILVSQGSGQEAANSNIILSHRCGVLAESEKEVLAYLQDVLDYPYIAADAKRAALTFGKPSAARQAAAWFLQGMP
jgi:processive 1,2-diacylglycerol beta-glucosyltransferase